MTKDVLVSVRGTQLMGEENDVIEIITPGTWYEKNGKQFLIYEESITDGGDVTRNTVRISPERVDVIKNGTVCSRMAFEPGKRHTANYVTPVGLIVLGLTTSSLEVEETKELLRVSIRYSLEMNGEYVSGCTMELSAAPRKKAKFI